MTPPAAAMIEAITMTVAFFLADPFRRVANSANASGNVVGSLAIGESAVDAVSVRLDSVWCMLFYLYNTSKENALL